MDRRELLKLSAAGLCATAFPPLRAEASVIQLGSASLSVVSDGNLVLPGDFLLPPDVPEDQIKTYIPKLPESYEPACNVSLWQNEDSVVLFDAGSGPNFMPRAGKLPEALESLGIDPSDVTDVVFTHAHPDHLWGVMDDFDELTFPEASYHMHATEWDYWRAEHTIDKLPEARKSFAVGAQNRMELFEDQINLFQYGDEVLSGIEAVDTAGHTPGHTSFALHSGSESVMVLGDAILHPVLSFQKYDWPAGGDQDRAAALATRKKLLDRLVADKMRMLGFHLPHPGLGYAERSEMAYRYVIE